MKNADRYSDIINLPHHQSATRHRMSNYDRAAQFSPFAALKGYNEEIEEAQRNTQAKRKLTDEQIAEINEKLILLKSKEGEQPLIEITYFEPDTKKGGGEYRTVKDKFRTIDEYKRKLVLSTMEVEFDKINDIRSD